jgi:hypothetical protein
MEGLMKKTVVLAVAMLAASVAYADQLYIVPVFATRIAGASGQSTAHVHIFNPGPAAAVVTVSNVYPSGGVLDCPLAPVNQTINPLNFREDIRPFCGANIVAAYTISSDRPLVITDDIETAGSGHIEHQSVRVLADWLPANRPIVVPNVAIASSGTDRTNLFLVNPNPFPITVSVRFVSALSSPSPALDLAIDVPARTSAVRALPTSLIVCAAIVGPCASTSDVLVQATGIFYAGASWLENDDPVYRDPTVAGE